MKTLEWIRMYQFNDNNQSFISLVERTNDAGLIVWGICKEKTDGLYQPVVRTADRKTLQTVLEQLPLKDAQEAIEKKLLDDGVLQDGDEIEYRMTP